MTTRKFLNYPSVAGGDDDDRRIINPLASDGFEMNESDLWTTEVDDHYSEPQNHVPRRSKIPLKAHQQRKGAMSTPAARSMPVNVPEWSMVMRDEYKRHDDVGFDGADEIMLPPHVYLARTRIASFSVHEGVGRTLKGRDLSRVRNAIWKQTGFEQD